MTFKTHDPLHGYTFETHMVSCQFEVPESDMWALSDCESVCRELEQAIRETEFALPDDDHGTVEPMAGNVVRFYMDSDKVTPENVQHLAGLVAEHVALAKATLAARDRADLIDEWFDIVNMGPDRDEWEHGKAWAEYDPGDGVDSFRPEFELADWENPGASMVKLYDDSTGEHVATVRLDELQTVYEDSPGKVLAKS